MKPTRPACIALLLTGACDRAPSQPAAQPISVRAPGATPTNERSFELLGRAPQERVAALQHLVAQSGNSCATPTQATFEGGIDSTDEWTLVCSDSAWTIWLKPTSDPVIERREG